MGLRINDRIRADKVRLIDESNNQVGVVGLREALGKARETGMDLVEVAPTSDPPVCRIMDYGKWLYQQKRKIREAHKKHHYHTMTLKEIRLRPETDPHDLSIKVNHAREFLEKGHKVQFTVFFRGRQMLHAGLHSTHPDNRILRGFGQGRAALHHDRKAPQTPARAEQIAARKT
ncbi:MAG: translation initiation factor IF-3 [Planctomycetota bacterium]